MQDTLLQREKWLIISVLLALSVLAWIFTVYQAQTHVGMGESVPRDMPSMAMPEPSHAGMSMPGIGGNGAAPAMGASTMVVEVVLFLLMWVAMMIAMMFPATYPMVLLFARVSKGQRGQVGAAGVPTWIFVAGYLAIWTVFGIFAYPVFLGMRWLGAHVAWLGDHAPLLSGLVLIGVGLYQFSHWKRVCLTHCRSPLSFILHKWREGVSGAFRMGVDHGAYCVGCCWGLMVVLFAVGLMHLAWMGLLSVAIFVEKVSQYGGTLGKVIGGVLILLGLVLLLTPRLLPGFLA
ncbi:MAG: DUF2182 domain-containing protein [Nitrospinae bacterium]|nr:DUF2182 domain-containing protein [Nitrospinota bacterium]